MAQSVTKRLVFSDSDESKQRYEFLQQAIYNGHQIYGNQKPYASTIAEARLIEQLQAVGAPSGRSYVGGDQQYELTFLDEDGDVLPRVLEVDPEHHQLLLQYAKGISWRGGVAPKIVDLVKWLTAAPTTDVDSAQS